MFRRFVKEELGLEMVEWAVVAVGIVIAAILVFGNIGGLVRDQMGTVEAELRAPGSSATATETVTDQPAGP